MKKLGFITSAVLYLSTLTQVLAQPTIPAIKVTPPTNQGYSTLSGFITNFLTVSFAVAILVVLVMLIWGAFEWITSGGDKDSVGKARNRIINALIGLAVLAVAFALAKIAGQFLGFDLSNIRIPGPGQVSPAPADQL